MRRIFLEEVPYFDVFNKAHLEIFKSRIPNRRFGMIIGEDGSVVFSKRNYILVLNRKDIESIKVTNGYDKKLKKRLINIINYPRYIASYLISLDLVLIRENSYETLNHELIHALMFSPLHLYAKNFQEYKYLFNKVISNYVIERYNLLERYTELVQRLGKKAYPYIIYIYKEISERIRGLRASS